MPKSILRFLCLLLALCPAVNGTIEASVFISATTVLGMLGCEEIAANSGHIWSL